LWKKGKTDGSDDDIRGLGGAVGALGSAIGSNKKFRGIFKKYKKKNNDKKMSEATVMFVQFVTEGKGLVDSISNYLGKSLKGVDLLTIFQCYFCPFKTALIDISK
jgi:hypothetical protein